MTLNEFYSMYRPTYKNNTVGEWKAIIDMMLRPMVFADMGYYYIADYLRDRILEDSFIKEGSSQLEELMDYIFKSLDNMVNEYDDSVSDFSIIDDEDFVV